MAPVAMAASVSPADRAAINRTLDAFVPTAVARNHSERAWALATHAMRASGTRAAWARGDLPVAPFPAAGRTFHGWTVDAVRLGAVDLVLLLHPRKGANVGPISFDVTMRKVGGRWLIDSFVPAAVFAAPGKVSSIQAAPDFAPGPAAPPFSKSGRIGENWVLVNPSSPGGADRLRAAAGPGRAPPTPPAGGPPVLVGEGRGLEKTESGHPPL
jgi:hypothetical protein